MKTSEGSNSLKVEQLIQEAHLALMRRDLDTAVSNLREVLNHDPSNSDALEMISGIQTAILVHERDVRISADDLRIKKERDEAWKRDQKYKNQQLLDSILHPDFGRRMNDTGWDTLLDFLMRG